MTKVSTEAVRGWLMAASNNLRLYVLRTDVGEWNLRGEGEAHRPRFKTEFDRPGGSSRSRFMFQRMHPMDTLPADDVRLPGYGVWVNEGKYLRLNCSMTGGKVVPFKRIAVRMWRYPNGDLKTELPENFYISPNPHMGPAQQQQVVLNGSGLKELRKLSARMKDLTQQLHTLAHDLEQFLED